MVRWVFKADFQEQICISPKNSYEPIFFFTVHLTVRKNNILVEPASLLILRASPILFGINYLNLERGLCMTVYHTVSLKAKL